MMEEGHRGLSNVKKEETSIENFNLALSFLEIDRHTGYFVIHVYSKSYELNSPYLQRSNVGQTTRWKKNFLERLGFTHFSSCNVLGGECYFKVIEEVNRDEAHENAISQMMRNTIIIDRYKKFAGQIADIYKRMRTLDQILTDVGFDLPREKLELSPIDYGKEGIEKVYPKGCLYDFYRDMLELIKQAENEVIITDNYADEELINLYLEKIPESVKIRVLTKKPQGNFIAVAKKFKAKPSVSFEARASNDWHDRWVFIDNECWVTGQSVKYAGEKPTYLIKLGGYDILKNCFEEAWNKASQLV